MKQAPPVANIGFPKPALLAMVAMALLGGIAVALSLVFHSRIHTRYLEETIRERQPHEVVVAAVGTPVAPGFVGFLVDVTNGVNQLTVTPLPGSGLVSVALKQGDPPVRLPLWQAVSEVPPATAARVIASAYHLSGSYYFLTSTQNLLTILDALANHATGGDQLGSVTSMLETLGYPDGTVHPARELQLLAAMIRTLPRLNPLVASSLLTVTKTSHTNLSGYQMFQLANVVRGDSFRLGQLPAAVRSSHGQ